MIQVRVKGRRGVELLERRDTCATDYCMNAPLQSSHYCRSCRKSVKTSMEMERLRFFGRSVPYDFAKCDTNLYAIAAANEAVKFGFANDVTGRLMELQVGNHVALRLLAALPCNRQLERLVHDYLASEWITGEWHALESKSKLVIAIMSKRDIEGLVKLVTSKN